MTPGNAWYVETSPSPRGAFSFAHQSFASFSLLLVAPFLVLAPNYDLITGIGSYNEQRLFQALVLLIGGAMLLSDRKLRDSWLATVHVLPCRSRIVLAMILLGGIVSASLAPSPRHAWLEVSSLGLLGCLTLQIADTRRRLGPCLDNWIVIVMTLSIVCYFVKFMVGYLVSLDLSVDWSVRELFHDFANPRGFGSFQIWSLSLVVLPNLLWEPPRWARWALAGLAMSWWMLAFASGTRATMAAMFVAFVVVFATCRPQARAWLKAQTQSVIGGLVLYISCFHVVLTESSSSASMLVGGMLERGADLSGRGALWIQALWLMDQYPVLGAGPMHFAYYPSSEAASAHNVPLQWAAEWGMPSAAALGALALWGLLACVKHIRTSSTGLSDQQQTVRVSLFATLVAVATYSLVSSITVTAVSQIMLALVLGWSLALHFGDCKTLGSAERSVAAHYVLMLTVGLAIILMVYGMVPEAFDPTGYQKSFVEQHGTRMVWPRFWQQGFIYD